MAEQTTAVTEKKGRKEGRSPGYPGINLKTAIERAQILYTNEKRQMVPASIALKHWGYASKSSGGFMTLAALKKFNLVDDEGTGGNRKIRLTDLAFRILHDPDENSRQEAIKTAALAPSIHAELWQKYNGTLPSTASLKFQLRNDAGFTDSGADEFIRQFIETISFAKLQESDTLSGVETESGGEKPNMRQAAHRTDDPLRQDGGQEKKNNEPGGKTIVVESTLPLHGGSVVLRWPNNLSNEDYEDFEGWLEIMKRRVKRSIQTPGGNE